MMFNNTQSFAASGKLDGISESIRSLVTQFEGTTRLSQERHIALIQCLEATKKELERERQCSDEKHRQHEDAEKRVEQERSQRVIAEERERQAIKQIQEEQLRREDAEKRVEQERSQRVIAEEREQQASKQLQEEQLRRKAEHKELIERLDHVVREQVPRVDIGQQVMKHDSTSTLNVVIVSIAILLGGVLIYNIYKPKRGKNAK